MKEHLTGAQGAQKVFSFPLRLLAAIFVSTVFLSGLSAQGNSANSHGKESERAAQVRALNNSVLQLHGEMQQNSSDAASVRSRAAQVLTERATALHALMQENPHASLTFAFSPELLADLSAKFPSLAASLLESHVTTQGHLEHWFEDNRNSGTGRSYYRMKVGQEYLNLHFAGAEPVAKGNQQFILSGVVLGSDMAVESAKPISGVNSFAPLFFVQIRALNLLRQCGPALLLVMFLTVSILVKRIREFREWASVLCPISRKLAVIGLGLAISVFNPISASAQGTCSTTGVQNVAVLLVTFPGVTPPSNVTPQSVYDMFFSTTGPSLDGFWREASYGQTSASGNVYGWYTLDSSYAACTNMPALRDAAIASAVNAGVPIQNYNRLFIVATDFGCGWTGLAMGECTTLNSPNGSFTASTSFLNANWQRSQTEGAETAAHEAGHNMGLDHAQSRTFGTEPLGSLGTLGTVTEYGDPFSDMSTSNIEHYALPHKAEILNWISNGNNYQVVQNSGSWTLQPLEINPSGLVALKVQRGSGNNAWLWVEYRQPIGIYDSQWDPSGALIHYEDSTTGSHTQLLDFTPGTSGLYDGALMPGSTWTDPYSNVSITVQSATANALTVSVNYSAASSCVSSAPTVNVSPLNPSIYAGQTASYAVSITNNDSSGCAPSAINVGSNEPSGWSTSLSSSSVTLGPGQSASVSLGKGSPLSAPVGTYFVNFTASNTTSNATDTANATVVTPPSLSATVSVSAASFTRPGTVPITTVVMNGGVPVAGASVAYTLMAPNGNKTTQSAITNGSGAATWNFKLNQKSLVGSYSVTAQATLSSGTRKSASTQGVSSNTATFSVQ